MATKNNDRQGTAEGPAVAVRNKEHLNNDPSYGKIDRKRQVEIFSQLVRHLTAICYLLAELHLGKKPEKL